VAVPGGADGGRAGATHRALGCRARRAHTARRVQPPQGRRRRRARRGGLPCGGAAAAAGFGWWRVGGGRGRGGLGAVGGQGPRAALAVGQGPALLGLNVLMHSFSNMTLVYVSL